jgi:hypothetical protein
MLDTRSDAMQRQDQPGSPSAAGAVSVRDVDASPAGPVRIELRMSPLRLVVSGPALPRVCVERAETTAERARREKAEAKAARRGKPPPPPPVVPGERQLKERLSLPDVFPRQREAAGLTVDGSPAGLMPGRALIKRASFDVRAQVYDRQYVLSQIRGRQARVTRHGRTVAELRRTSRYGRGPRYDPGVAWADGADPTDVAMTHALASAYSVGAWGFPLNLLRAAGRGIVAILTLAAS